MQLNQSLAETCHALVFAVSWAVVVGTIVVKLWQAPVRATAMQQVLRASTHCSRCVALLHPKVCIASVAGCHSLLGNLGAALRRSSTQRYIQACRCIIEFAVFVASADQPCVSRTDRSVGAGVGRNWWSHQLSTAPCTACSSQCIHLLSCWSVEHDIRGILHP